MEALVTWLAAESEGATIARANSRGRARDVFPWRGDFLLSRRAHDFSCATCHEQSDMRIRLQALPDLTSHTGAAEAEGSWPATIFPRGLVRTMGWRLRDCFRQQRWPELQMGSEASIALQTYMAVNAAGGVMTAPGLKR